MSYEPRGKVKTLLDAMRADPTRVWTAPEVAKVLECPQNAVLAHLLRALENRVIYKELLKGRNIFSLQPFGTVAPPPGAPTVDPNWRPPQMVPPRGTPEPTAAPAPVFSGATVVVGTRMEAAAAEAAASSAPPEPAPVLADASTTEAASAQVDEEPEVTWTMWEDGDIDLFGLVELENGGYRLPAEALGRLRKFVAWMPA
jgi:hypothetical protein